MGYYHQHSNEPFPLMSDSMISGLGGERHGSRTVFMEKVNS